MRCEVAVLLTADRAGRLFRTGCRAARVAGHLLAADIAVVVIVCVFVRRYVLFISAGAFVPVVCRVGRPLGLVGVRVRHALPDCIERNITCNVICYICDYCARRVGRPAFELLACRCREAVCGKCVCASRNTRNICHCSRSAVCIEFDGICCNGSCHRDNTCLRGECYSFLVAVYSVGCEEVYRIVSCRCRAFHLEF